MKNKILLIDDDLLVLKTLKGLLLRHQYEVVTAENADEAESYLKEHSVDLIVSDIRMPSKDGVSTVRDIQNRVKAAKQKEIPIIFLTGYADMSRELNANFLGEILHKPIDNDKLLFAIRDYL